jgi:hypothetical protein
MSDGTNNTTESVWGVISSVLAYIASHLFNIDSVIFRIVVAPAVGATIGFFVVKGLKKIFPDKNESK